jgi:hypothetical protein
MGLDQVTYIQAIESHTDLYQVLIKLWIIKNKPGGQEREPRGSSFKSNRRDAFDNIRGQCWMLLTRVEIHIKDQGDASCMDTMNLEGSQRVSKAPIIITDTLESFDSLRAIEIASSD